MSPLNKYFDAVYVINLPKRVDRREHIQSELQRNGIKHTIFNAIDGSEFNEIDSGGIRWNRGALALRNTTIGLLKEAKEKGCKNVFIFEDDCCIHDSFNEVLDGCLNDLPDDYFMFFAGLTHKTSPKEFKGVLWGCTSGFSCHSYGINLAHYDLLMKELTNKPFPVDVVADNLMGLGKSYCAFPNLTWQKNGYSDISEKHVDVSFTKQGNY